VFGGAPGPGDPDREPAPWAPHAIRLVDGVEVQAGDSQQDQEALAQRDGHGVGGVPGFKLGPRCLRVQGDGLGAEVEVAGDLLDGQAVGEALEDLSLAGAELRRARRALASAYSRSAR